MRDFNICRHLILVCAFAARIRSETNSVRYMEFPNAVPGAIMKVEKVLDQESGRITTRIGGVTQSSDRLFQLQGIEEKARSAKRGNLSEELEARRPAMGWGERLRVVVYPRYPEFRYPDKTRASEESMRASSVSASTVRPMEDLPALAKRHGLGRFRLEDEGRADCEVDKAQLEALKADPSVGAVELFRVEAPSAPEISTLAVSARNPGPIPSGAGLGVRAATFESGLTSSFLGCLGVSAVYDASNTPAYDEIRHSQSTFKALVNTAPSASFYHRNSVHYDGADDINYIINNGIQTTSISFSKGGSNPLRSTAYEFLVMDDFAYRAPYPVFATPTHNNGYQYEANWQCYNAISVGNVRHTNGTTYELAGCTQTKNPPPVYGSCISGTGSNCAGDREMPHVVAPGIPSSGSTFATTCLEGDGNVFCGTSFSAPIVNGLAASVISADSRMVSWPEKVRATLILTAQDVETGDWAASGDERDGTGVVSGSEAISFAQGHTSVSPGNSAAEKGMAAASMYASDFTSGNKRFYFRVPNPKPADKHLRVVLTWDSNPVVGGGVNALSDLDLIVQKEGGTQASASWDSNVEVVDVAASNLTAGGTYYIDISPYSNRIPSSGSRTNFFYYALAWSWVKDHAP